MSNAQVFHDPLREDLDYLIDRSREHERELKQLRSDEEGRRQFEYLQGRARQHDSQLTEICDKWAFVTDCVGRQNHELESLTNRLKTLENTVGKLSEDKFVSLTNRLKALENKVGKLSEDTSVLAGQPRPRVVRLGNVLYRVGAGLAAILLAGGIWMFTDVIADANADGSAWLLPTILIVGSVVTALTARALGYLLAGQ